MLFSAPAGDWFLALRALIYWVILASFFNSLDQEPSDKGSSMKTSEDRERLKRCPRNLIKQPQIKLHESFNKPQLQAASTHQPTQAEHPPNVDSLSFAAADLN